MPKQIITQRQLRNIIRLKDTVTEAKSALKAHEAELSALEHAVTTAMKSEEGYRVESGKYSAVLEERDGQCRPPWKDVYLEHFVKEHDTTAKAEEQRIRDLYPAEKSEVLVVGERK
jgi:hypothetical protein